MNLSEGKPNLNLPLLEEAPPNSEYIIMPQSQTDLEKAQQASNPLNSEYTPQPGLGNDKPACEFVVDLDTNININNPSLQISDDFTIPYQTDTDLHKDKNNKSSLIKEGKEFKKNGCVFGDGWIFSIIIIIIFLAGIALFIVRMIMVGFDTLTYVFIGIAGGFYLIYWIEGCCSSTSFFLSNMLHDSSAKSYAKEMKRVAPQTDWSIQNYHYEERVYWEKDEKGEDVRKTSRERVNTSNFSTNVHYTNWADNSAPIGKELSHYKITRLYITPHIVYGPGVLESLNMRKNDWIQNHRRDTHYDFHESTYIPGLIHKILAINGELDPFLKRHNSRCSFSLSLLLFYGWYIRLWLHKHSNSYKHQLIKTIYSFTVSTY